MRKKLKLDSCLVRAIALLISFSANAVADDQYYSGYAIIQAADSGKIDLQQMVYLEVASDNVLGSLNEILRGTGYRLAAEAAADPQIPALYIQPYPNNQRKIGPSPLGEVLEMIGGDAWRLVVDPVNRVISYETHERYQE